MWHELGDLISYAKVKRARDLDLPVLSMTSKNGIMLQNNRFKKDIASKDRSNYKVVRRGQFVFGFPMDEGVMYSQKIVDEGILSPAYDVCDVKKSIIDPNYLEAYLHGPRALTFIKEKLRGTTARRRVVPKDQLGTFTLDIPSLGDQSKRLNRLSLMQLLLENEKQLLVLLDELVQSRFIEMFGDTNNSMEWPIANVESIAKVKVGLVIKPTRFYSSSPTRYKAIRGLNISPFCINDTNWVYFTEDGAKSNKKTEVKENDVVVVRSGAPGTAAVVTKEYAGSNAIDVLIVEPDLTQIDPTYLCAYTNFPHGLKQISKGSGGAAQKHFNVEKYKNLTIFIPPLEKQKLFSIEKKEIDKSKLAIQKSIDELETLKKKLMQEYFG